MEILAAVLIVLGIVGVAITLMVALTLMSIDIFVELKEKFRKNKKEKKTPDNVINNVGNIGGTINQTTNKHGRRKEKKN